MNKKGQTLILFVIFLPIFLGVSALVVDVGLIVSKKTQIKEVSKLVIKDSLNKDYDITEIKGLLKKNKLDINNLDINKDSNTITIDYKYNVRSIFGGLIGFKEYEITGRIKGYKDKEEVKYKG